MTTTFNSFDGSKLGAFVKSPLGVRNRVRRPPEGTVDPIIFIIGSMTQLPFQHWKAGGGEGGWTWTLEGETLTTPTWYDGNPDSFAADLVILNEALAAHQVFNYAAVNKNKPNWQIWLWQPVGANIVGTGFVYSTVWSVVDPNFLTSLQVRTMSAGSVDGAENATVLRLPLLVEAFNVPVTIFGSPSVIVKYLPGPPGSTTTLDYPELGDSPHVSRVDWLIDRAYLVSVWEKIMRPYESLTPVFRDLPPNQNHGEVTLQLQNFADINGWLLDPFVARSYGRAVGDVPVRVVTDHIQTMPPPTTDNVRVTTGLMPGGARWPLAARSIINGRMR